MPWIVGGAILGGSLLSAGASKSAAGTQANAAGQASKVQQNMFDTTQNNLAPWLQSGKVSLQALMQGAGLQTPGIDWNKYLTDNPDVAADSFFGNNPQQHYEQFGKNEGRAVSMIDPSQPNGTGIAPGSLLKPFGMEDFQASPAYQFNLEQGQQAINKAAAARGKFYAPGTLQDVSRFSQGLASNEFQNAYSNYNTNLNNIWSRLSGLSGSGQNAAANLGGFAQNTAGQIGNNITGAANASAAGTVGSANAINQGLGSAYNSYLMQQILAGNQGSTVPGANMNSAGAGDIQFQPTG